MKAAYLDSADPEEVSHAVREVLERRGALVSEHLHSRVRFRGLVPARHTWSREGYVGIYQHTGEREVEVRLLLRARWPWRILWTVALVNVLGALAVLITQPSGTVWFLVAFTEALALLVAGIIYVQTLRPVRREERDLMEEMEAELARDIEGVSVLDDEARTLAQQEAELEGEIARRRIERARKAESANGASRGGFRLPKFSLRPKRAQSADDAEPEGELAESSDAELAAKRQQILARKAELEARRREMEQRGQQ